MKALAINGSPRVGGNTETLLKAALAPLAAAGWETELVQLGGKLVHGCLACFQCGKRQDRRCAVTNDVMNEVLEKLWAADAILLGSPTYFTDVTTEIKALIDRAGFVAMANGGLLRGKIGAAVVAVRRGGGTHVFDSINHFFHISRMIVPGSTYWNIGYGLEPGSVANDAEGLNNMRHLGEVIAWLGPAVADRIDAYPDAAVRAKD